MPVILKVKGLPVPQGSMTCVGAGVTIRPGMKPKANHNVQPSNKEALYAWRNQIAAACRVAKAKFPSIGWIGHDPVAVTCTFTLERPMTVTRDWPSVPPDLDKLARAILDGLTAGEIWNDDGQCVVLNLVKAYPDTAPFCPFPEDVLDVPGVTIRLSDVDANRLI